MFTKSTVNRVNQQQTFQEFKNYNNTREGQKFPVIERERKGTWINKYSKSDRFLEVRTPSSFSLFFLFFSLFCLLLGGGGGKTYIPATRTKRQQESLCFLVLVLIFLERRKKILVSFNIFIYTFRHSDKLLEVCALRTSGGAHLAQVSVCIYVRTDMYVRVCVYTLCDAPVITRVVSRDCNTEFSLCKLELLSLQRKNIHSISSKTVHPHHHRN